MQRHLLSHIHRNDLLQRSLTNQLREHIRAHIKHHSKLRAVVIELMLQLIGGIQRVVLHNNCAQAQDRRDYHDVLGAVRQRHSHTVARANAQRGQRRSSLAHLLIELRVGQLLAHEPRCGSLGLSCHDLVEPAHQRVIANRRIRVGPAGVLLDPGLLFACSHVGSFGYLFPLMVSLAKQCSGV